MRADFFCFVVFYTIGVRFLWEKEAKGVWSQYNAASLKQAGKQALCSLALVIE